MAFFVAIARELGQDGFGDFIFALSLTTVLLIAAGFGTEDLVTREIARDRTSVHHYVADTLALKALTSIALLAVAVGVAWLAGYRPTCRRWWR